MTPQEAIEILNNYGSLFPQAEQKAIDVAVLALEKQIPHKLAPKQSGNSEIPVCGKCNSIMDLMQGELNYCPNCGQALDL